MQSRQSTLKLLNLPSVEMIRSTSQMNSKIIVNISSLKAYLRSDFFLFKMATTVQMTKNTPEPIIVLKMNEGYLNAQAYYASTTPKESQLNLRAGCVSIFNISDSFCCSICMRELCVAYNDLIYFCLASPHCLICLIL